MRIVRRGLAGILLFALLTCNILPELRTYEWGTVYAAQETQGETEPYEHHELQELDELMASGEVAPVEPEKEIAEDGQLDSAIGDAVVETTAKSGFGKIREVIEKVLADEAADILRESERLGNKGRRKLMEAAEVSSRKAERLMRKGNNCLTKSHQLADEAASWKLASNVAKGVGIGMDLWSIASNMEAMQNLNNERASMQVLETTALAADTVLAVVSIAAAITGAVSPPGLFLSVTVGVVSAILHSEGFANWANNIDSEFLDAVDEFFETLFPWMKTPNGVDCYKPNIYFYTDSEKQVSVRFSYPQLLTATIPDYESGWQVRLTEDGRLITEDGEEHRFLFYESVTFKTLFQTETGYEVPAETREETFERILTSMGFNETEIADFTEFWCEKLEQGVDYLMYPQNTETVDLAMPIEVSPMPESIERIWFVFCADEGQEVSEPELEVIERNDEYALVEWGGMIFE